MIINYFCASMTNLREVAWTRLHCTFHNDVTLIEILMNKIGKLT